MNDIDREHPLIWVLTGHKTGDNAQVLRAARAMGLSFEIRKIVLKKKHETGKPRVSPSLRLIDKQRSDALSPPWPDLVIAIGRSMSLVALWIKKQSGSKTRIALFNAPKGRSSEFDLVIVPEYYQVVEASNILRIGMPLIAVDPLALAAAGQTFAPQFATLPRPVHGLLVGGGTGLKAFKPDFAVSLIRKMRQTFAAKGSLYVSTSRRTPPSVADAIGKELMPHDRIYRWSPEAQDNPYLGILSHCDTLTVTGDSLSMLTEVAKLGKPLIIASVPEQSPTILQRIFGDRLVRDFSKAHDYLCRNGHAVMLGEQPRKPSYPLPDETAGVAERLCNLAQPHVASRKTANLANQKVNP